MAAHFIAILGIFSSFSQLSLLFLTLVPKESRSIWSASFFFPLGIQPSHHSSPSTKDGCAYFFKKNK